MSYMYEPDPEADRPRDRSRREYERDRRSERDRRDRDRDRDRERDRSRERDRGRDRSRDDRRERDRERDLRDDRDRHGRHSRERHDLYDQSDESRGSDDWSHRRRSGSERNTQWNESIPNNIILVRGLPSEAVESDVVSELLKSGTVVKDVRLMRSKDTGYSLRYCFVEFHSLAEAQYWMESNQGEMMFWDKYPVNMYYSTSRRGTINSVQPPLPDLTPESAADWICMKCSCKNFQRRIFCRRCNHSRLETERVTAGDGLDQVGSNPCNTLILRGLDGLTTEENITAAIAAFTSMPLKNVRVIRDRLTGASSGFAFVELHSLKESQELLEFLESQPNPLEIDGKAILIAYAKNTFTTALATLEPTGQTFADYNQQQFTDYNSYYYNSTSAVPADTANAAEVAQAAILASQQKKQKQVTVSSSPAVLSAAPVLHSQQSAQSAVTATTATTDATTEYPRYPVPDVSTYQYDETSGYYYDPSTGLYYDANSQYYYNTQTQQYLYWDGEKQTYLPAPTSNEDQAKKEEEAKKRAASPDKKVKIAKRIVKDMEKWAKKLNQQKEQLKSVPVQPVVAEPIIPIEASSGTADAGFSLLEKAASTKKVAGTLSEIITSAGAPQTLYSQSELDQPVTSNLESGSGVMSVEELIDWNKLACLLCRRAFPSKDVLLKHQQMSDLHKKNVEDLIKAKGGGLSQDGSTLQYRDRARERREKYGVPEPPLPKRKRVVQEEPEPEPFEQPTASGIKDDNVGNRLLQKMGWKDGQGLGQRGQGIVDPIEAKQRHQSAGLGVRGSAYNVDPAVGSYKERARKTFYHYWQEIN